MFLDENIKNYIKTNNMSEVEFAKRANISKSVLTNILNKNILGRLKTIEKIAQVTNETLDDLYFKKINFN